MTSFADTKKLVFQRTEGGPNYVGGPALIERVFYIEKPEGQAPTTSTKARIERLSRDPRKAAALARARARIGEYLEDVAPLELSLVALRLRAGLSQTQLAERMGKQQSNVSRMEKDPGDMQLSTMKKLAEALGVQLSEIVDALERGQVSRNV